MLIRPERVWHRTPEALRRAIAKDVAALLAEVIHEIGTDRRPPPRTARGDLHPPVHAAPGGGRRSEEHTSELQSHVNLVCRLLLEKKKDRVSPLLEPPPQLRPEEKGYYQRLLFF